MRGVGCQTWAPNAHRAPDYAQIHSNKGFALRSLGELQVGLSQRDEALENYARAIEAYDEALRRAPDDVSAHNNKGAALINLGDLQAGLSRQDEAMQIYKWAVKVYSMSLEIAPAQENIRKLRDSIQQMIGS